MKIEEENLIELRLAKIEQVFTKRRKRYYVCRYNVTCSEPIVSGDVDLAIIGVTDEMIEAMEADYKRKHKDYPFYAELAGFSTEDKDSCTSFIKEIKFKSSGDILKSAKFYRPKSNYDRDFWEKKKELDKLAEFEFMKKNFR